MLVELIAIYTALAIAGAEPKEMPYDHNPITAEQCATFQVEHQPLLEGYYKQFGLTRDTDYKLELVCRVPAPEVK